MNYDSHLNLPKRIHEPNVYQKEAELWSGWEGLTLFGGTCLSFPPLKFVNTVEGRILKTDYDAICKQCGKPFYKHNI